MKVFIGCLLLIPAISLLFWLARKAFPAKKSAGKKVDHSSGEMTYDSEPLDVTKYICDRPSEFEGQPHVLAESYLRGACDEEQFHEFNRTQYPVKIGYYCKQGWSACLPFYLFKCLYCGQWTVGYKHGYQPKLKCFECDRLNYFYEFTS